METDKKLAENIIKSFIGDNYLPRHRMILDVDEIIQLMQEYAEKFHEAKMKEITDADIEVYLLNKELSLSITGSNVKYSEVYKLFFIEGAKAMRAGEIKRTKNQ